MRALRLANALLRATWRSTTRGKPRSSWSGSETFTVHLLQALLQSTVGRGAAVQRATLSEPAQRLPSGVREHEESWGGRRAWRWIPEDAHPTRLVVHFHGGGYVIGSPLENRAYLAVLARLLRVEVVSIAYRLCPEHPHPAAHEDGEAAVRALVDSGVAPGDIVLTGDSAGGGVALGTVYRLRDSGGPTVAGAVLGSPMVDLRAESASYAANAASDYLIRPLVVEWARAMGVADSDPSVSLVLADPTGLPPLRFLAGDAEIFRDDVVACAERAKAAGVDAEVVVGADAVHCWYKSPRLPGPSGGAEHVAAQIRGLYQR